MKRKTAYKPPPTIPQWNINPTYSLLSYVNVDESPINRNRHQVSPFRKKNEIQSRRSMNRLSNAVNWMLLFADKKTVFSKKENKHFSFRLAFITLTLSDKQHHTDKEVKEHMLQPFLYWITRYYKASYVWKAEAQINGRIHFHITVDTFIHWKSIRAKWNRILAKNNYCKVFQDGTNDKGNAATDVHSVRSEKEVAKYLASYMAKKDEVKQADKEKIENGLPEYEVHCKWDPRQPPEKQDVNWYKRPIDGRLWGCSEQLSSIKCYINDHTPEFRPSVNQFIKDNNSRNLGDIIKREQQKKAAQLSPQEREILRMNEEQIEKKFNHLDFIWIHRNLKYCKLPEIFGNAIAKLKSERQFNTQKHFTVESLF